MSGFLTKLTAEVVHRDMEHWRLTPRVYGLGIGVFAGHGASRSPLSPAGRLAALLPLKMVGSDTWFIAA